MSIEGKSRNEVEVIVLDDSFHVLMKQRKRNKRYIGQECIYDFDCSAVSELPQTVFINNLGAKDRKII